MSKAEELIESMVDGTNEAKITVPKPKDIVECASNVAGLLRLTDKQLTRLAKFAKDELLPDDVKDVNRLRTKVSDLIDYAEDMHKEIKQDME